MALPFPVLADGVRHLRPRAWPIVMVHFLTGAVVAHGAARVARDWQTFLFAAIVWAVGLNGGTLALNSAFDRDEGDVGYLDRPPPARWWLAPFALLFLVGGQVVAVLFGTKFAAAYAVCFLMSILYSVPPFRWKRLAGVDLAINCFGYGLWTFLAGAMVPALALHRLMTGVWESPREWLSLSLTLPERLGMPLLLVAVGFFFLFGALYPLTQLYQVEEDKRRGDRTLALWIGPRRSVLFALGCAVVAHAAFLAGLILAQRLAAGKIGLIPSFLCWSILLLLWYKDFQRYPHQRGMYRALAAWAATNVTVLALFGAPGT
ncbi:UbiA family prenyltransferase [bacterium]|nr:UbiA family prenyltransferase [bacterium]